jgi:hypothetical protein
MPGEISDDIKNMNNINWTDSDWFKTWLELAQNG